MQTYQVIKQNPFGTIKERVTHNARSLEQLKKWVIRTMIETEKKAKNVTNRAIYVSIPGGKLLSVYLKNEWVDY